MVDIIHQISESEWRYFLETCSDATLYHTPEWKMFLEKTFNYKIRYLFAIDECGKMTGLLPLVQINSRLTGNRLCSLPFCQECGCIGNEGVCKDLIDEAIALKNKSHIERIEIRKAVEHKSLQKQNPFSTYFLRLSHDPQEIWNNLDKGSVRWSIKKAEKKGVSVSSSIERDYLKEFYNLNCITKRNLGVPCHPWIFFDNLFSFLNGYVKIYLSWYRDELIGGGIMLYYGDTVLYGYGASNPEYHEYNPYYAFIWKSIQDACVNKYQCYDFGRSSYDNIGLTQFKKRWGTLERKLFHSYYPPPSQTIGIDRNSLIYRIGNSVIRRVPMSLYKILSTSVFSHLG